MFEPLMICCQEKIASYSRTLKAKEGITFDRMQMN